MNIIKKTFAGLLIWILSIGNVIAAGIPDEPMVIYGNISGNENNSLKIYDWGNNLLKEITVQSGKYGTNKTFGGTKIILNNFDWNLVFKNNWKFATVSKWEIASCNNSANFQKWSICEYNLSFSNTNEEIDLERFFDNISTDNLIIEEKYKTDDIDEIFNWKIFEENKDIVKNNIWDNILKSISGNDKIIVTSNKIEAVKKISKKIIIINTSKKEAVFIPENTESNEGNIVIEKPRKITNTNNIKAKVNKVIIWAVEIPTNKQITFNKFIRVCTQLIRNKTKALKIYYSHDNVNWTVDNTAKNLEISNGQVCFDVNHLTSFAVWEDETIVAPRHSSGWSSSKNYNLKKDSNVSVVTNVSKPQNKTTNKTTNNTQEKTITEKKTTNTIKKSIKKLDLKKYDWKKYINSELKLNSKIYIRNLTEFYKNTKIEDSSSYTIFKIKSDEEYNKIVDYYKKKIILEFKLPPIRESMFRHLNKMTTSYGIYKYNNLDENLTNFYKESFAENMNNFKFKLIRLKQKDDMISKTLEKRRKAKLNLK